FRRWLRVYVDYCTPECVYKNNNHNWQSLFLMCSGVVLGDTQVFERGLGYYQSGFHIQVERDGALPMEMWRKEKCATYTLMALEAMLQAAFIAGRHGHPEVLQLRSDAGTSLRDAVNCLVSFLEAPDTWQVERRRASGGPQPQNRPEDPSDWGWALELPCVWWGDDHYAKYMGRRPYGEGIRAYSLSYATLLFAR
ncbi:MAG: alginate lyase family protein, partial [Armatimonadota bacterium]